MRIRDGSSDVVSSDLVDIPPRRRDERVRETVLIFLRPLRDLFGVTDVAAEDDFDRALRAHHRDFGGRPSIVEVAAQMLRRNNVIHRNRVVEGKSVPLSVDSGGRRFLKKKTKNK